MKIRSWKCTIISCLFIVWGGVTVHAQTPYCMESPVGYAEGATGGGTPSSSNTVTVTSSSELSSALSGSKSVILVSGTITTGRMSGSYRNKTIIGLPGATLVNLVQTKEGSGILTLNSGSSNIIIRNLTFVGPGAYDCDGYDLLTNLGCIKLWVDHCDFQDGVDGNFDNTKTCDDITVSWCKFGYLKPPKAGGSGGSNDHRFTNLIGGSDSDVPSDGKYSITWLNCYWANGCVDRMVRARNAQVDMINCYWNSSSASKNIHLSPGTNGTYVYVENGVFDCSGQIVNFEKTGNNNIVFVNCSQGGSNTGSVAKPNYTYPLTPVDKVASMAAHDGCGAGATLKVTADGTLSSGCSTTGIVKSWAFEAHDAPMRISASGEVMFPASSSSSTRVTLYAMNGQMVYTAAKMDGSVLKHGSLNAGVYFVKLQDGSRVTTATLIMK